MNISQNSSILYSALKYSDQGGLIDMKLISKGVSWTRCINTLAEEAERMMQIPTTQVTMYSFLTGKHQTCLKEGFPSTGWDVALMKPGATLKDFKRKETFRFLPEEKLLRAGMTPEELELVEEAGFMYIAQFDTQKGKKFLFLVPESTFLSSLCKKIGRKEEDVFPNPERDFYLCSEMGTVAPFSFLAQKTSRGIAHCYECVSASRNAVSQMDGANATRILKKGLGNVDFSYYLVYDRITYLFFEYGEEVRTHSGSPMRAGFLVTMSNTGDSAASVCAFVRYKENRLYLPYISKSRNSKNFSYEELYNNFLSAYGKEMKELPERLQALVKTARRTRTKRKWRVLTNAFTQHADEQEVLLSRTSQIKMSRFYSSDKITLSEYLEFVLNIPEIICTDSEMISDSRKRYGTLAGNELAAMMDTENSEIITFFSSANPI